MRAQSAQFARLAGALLFVGSAAPAAAQLANASAAATGLSGAYTARARGYNALAWNPANLAMPGNPGFSLTLPTINGSANLKPIDLSMIAEFSGKPLPKATREAWMQQVVTEGGETGGVNSGITLLALSLGPIALQQSTTIAVNSNLGPGAVEALLFGNAGRADTVRQLTLAGSGMDVMAYSTVAAGIGRKIPILLPMAHLTIGVTAKYTVGHMLFIAQDQGSSMTNSGLDLRFPGVYADPDSSQGQAGSGMGFDVGIAGSLPTLQFGFAVQNVSNSFAWDTTKFVSRGLNGLMSADTNSTNTDAKGYSTAPAALRAKVASLTFKRVMSGGVAFNLVPKITMSADFRQAVGDGIVLGPEQMVAGGLEARIIPLLRLRAGAMSRTDGYGVSGGVGLHLLGFEVGVAGYLNTVNGNKQPGMTISGLSIRP